MFKLLINKLFFFILDCSSVVLRPIVLGFVDGTKTVVSRSYLCEKTGYSLVHSDIQVCTYHMRLNWNARDTKDSSSRTVFEMGLDCSCV